MAVLVVIATCGQTFVIAAQDTDPPTVQVVSLDKDPDIDTWIEGVKKRFEAKVVCDVRTFDINEDELTRGFYRLGDWVLISGHFTEGFWHHTQDIDEGPRMKIKADQVVLEKDGDVIADTDRREAVYENPGPRYVFLRGCKTLHYDQAVKDARAFFAKEGTPPVLIGWLDDTGWQIAQAAMGGFGNKPPMPRKDFFDRLPEPGEEVDEHDVINAWLGAIAETFWGKGSTVEASASCIDSDGVEWIIKDDKVVKSGRRF